MNAAAVTRLRELRRTQRMLATKAQKQADSHRASADAITSALEALGAESADTEGPTA